MLSVAAPRASEGRQRSARRQLHPILLSLLSIVAFACSDPKPLAQVKTLGKDIGSVALPAYRADGATIGEDRRPAALLPRQRPLTEHGKPVAVAGGMEQTFQIGPLSVGRRIVVTRLYRTKQGGRVHELPSVLVTPGRREFTLRFEGDDLKDPATAQLIPEAFLVPPAEETLVIEAIDVPPRATLSGGFGLDPIGRGVATRPVTFRVLARGDAGAQVLLERVLDPADAGAHGWSSYEIDVAELAGKRVTIELQSIVQAGDGEDPEKAIGFPIWSAPTLLAPPSEALREARNAILISLDTLRADFVGAYGQKLPTTPNLDQLAGESTLFEKVFTTYPSTTASHMSMLTGFVPGVHGVYAPGARLARGIPLLAEILARRGYRTMAVTEDAMLAANSGFPRGFETYREYKTPDTETDGHVREVVDDAIGWLRAHRGERFFMFLHTYQVHSPYTPPAEFDVFPEAAEGPWGKPAKDARRGYAGDLLYADQEIGRLVAELEKLGEAERTVLVVTSDHGEMLGEHGQIGHGWYVLEPAVRIPLVIRAPGAMPAGQRVAAPVSLADVTPTILELLGGTPAPLVQGKSLVGLAADPTDRAAHERVVYIERMRVDGGRDLAVRKGDVKWVSTAGKLVRFDLDRDPSEESPSTDPAGLNEGAALDLAYRQEIERIRAALGGAKPDASTVDEATKQKLRALGYTD